MLPASYMMSAQPSTISVIVPTYNRGHLLERALRSVLTQTHQQLELIIVDDGSVDNTADVVSTYDADSRVRYIRHQDNLGSSVARNTGIRHAQGEYIAFLDSDDEWLPTKLEKQMLLFQYGSLPRLGAVNCGIINVRERQAREDEQAE